MTDVVRAKNTSWDDISCSQNPHQLTDMNIQRYFASLYIILSPPRASLQISFASVTNYEAFPPWTFPWQTSVSLIASNCSLHTTETASTALIRGLMSVWIKLICDCCIHYAWKKTKQCTACLSARWCSEFTLGRKPRGGLAERQHIRAELGPISFPAGVLLHGLLLLSLYICVCVCVCVFVCVCV